MFRLPLAINEWEEWGNPNEKKYFQYMMEYSPMQNVKKAKYPACLIVGGLHDPRVQYWEPAVSEHPPLRQEFGDSN